MTGGKRTERERINVTQNMGISEKKNQYHVVSCFTFHGPLLLCFMFHGQLPWSTGSNGLHQCVCVCARAHARVGEQREGGES